MKWLSAVALCLVVVHISGQDYDDWIKSVNVAQGESLSFNCTEEGDETSGHPRPEDDDTRPWVNATVQYWLAHFDIVNPGDSIRGGNINVSADGWSMTVMDVTPEFFGIYHCVMETDEGSTYLVKWGINMRGPYFVDLWDKYEMNVIIGFSAMGGFLVLAAFVMGLYHFRWVDPDEELKKQWIDPHQEMKKEQSEKGAFVNQAYSNGEYNEPHDGLKGFEPYEELKTPPKDEEYTYTTPNDPVVVSVAEVHSDSAAPVYVISNQSTTPSSLPEPEEDTKF